VNVLRRNWRTWLAGGLAVGWFVPTPALLASGAALPPSPPLFSENFESGELDKSIWTQSVTGENLIEVQREKVAHGNFALHVHCPGPSSKTWAFILTQHLPAALRRHHFGRAYMFVTPKPPDRHTILIMAGTPGFPQNKFQEIATTGGKWQLTYVDLRPEGDKEDYHSGGSVPLGRWFCLEWEFNDQPNRVAVSIDGQPVYETGFVSKRTGATTDLIGGFDEFALGFRIWGAAPESFDLYYDDLALDTKPIGPIAGPVGGK
jgi:hypothetical protein